MLEYLNNIVDSIDKVNTNELKLKDFKPDKLFKLFLNQNDQENNISFPW